MALKPQNNVKLAEPEQKSDDQTQQRSALFFFFLSLHLVPEGDKLSRTLFFFSNRYEQKVETTPHFFIFWDTFL